MKMETRSSLKALKSYTAPSLFSTWSSQVLILGRARQVKHTSVLLMFNVICLFLLLAWCSSTQSLALQSYTYTVGFNFLSLLTCILSMWVEWTGPTPLFSFGCERFEVLAVFANTVLAQLGSLFIAKESIERLLLEQPDIHIGHLMLGTGVAFASHIVVIYGCNNAALDHVIAASSSSWLQEHVSDISQSICSVVPMLSGLLLPRINPMLLVACAGAVSLSLADLLIQIKSCYVVDTLVAMFIAAATFATMLPMSIYSGKVLLQTTPSHVVGQLDKCLRETLTIDGVLEFRNEHFWTLSFGKMAGSIQVRVRRDADEQLVLAHVVDRLSNIVSVLTVQVFKDDWSMKKTGIMHNATHSSSPLTSHITNSPPLVTNARISNNSYPNVLVLPITTNSSVQNGNSSPHYQTISSSQVQSNIISAYVPNNSYKLNSDSIQISHFSVNSIDSVQRNSWKNTRREVQLFPDLALSSRQNQEQVNNLLFTGTRTLDANQFDYHPQ